MQNEIYLRHLVQGKRTNESYKQPRKTRYDPESEWRIFRNAHEPIIDENTFRICQTMAAESRARYEEMISSALDDKTPNIFSRRIYCADCGKALTRRQVYSRKNKENMYYIYFCVSSLRKASYCTPKNIHEDVLISIVMKSICCYIDAVTELEIRVKKIYMEKADTERRRIEMQIASAQHELSHIQSLYDSLYQSLVDGIISRQEYLSMKERYQTMLEENSVHLETLKATQRDNSRFTPDNPLFSLKREMRTDQKLTAELVQSLISRIEVEDNHRISITFNYQDEFKAIAQYVKEAEAE